MTKLIYVCSPFHASAERTLAQHILYAKQASRYVFHLGNVPVTPHLLYPCFLNDHFVEERNQGMLAGLLLMDACASVAVFSNFGVSAGMQQEIDYATEHKIPINTICMDPPHWTLGDFMRIPDEHQRKAPFVDWPDIPAF